MTTATPLPADPPAEPVAPVRPAAVPPADVTALVRLAMGADGVALLVTATIALFDSTSDVRWKLLALCAAFGCLAVATRLQRRWPLTRLAWISVLGLTTFVTAADWACGLRDGPFEVLYLLPVVLAALALHGAALWATEIAIGVSALLLALGGAPRPPGAMASHLIVLFAPLYATAWLVTELARAWHGARRRAAQLESDDPLTGLATRQRFLASLNNELESAAVRGVACGLLLVDLDHARRVNEVYGQEAGNAALRLIAGTLQRTLHAGDLAARWGGDEFAVLLVGADAQGARRAAQRIRRLVNTSTLEASSKILRFGISIGAASAPRDGRDASQLLAAAERRLARERATRNEAASPPAGAGSTSAPPMLSPQTPRARPR